MKKIIKNLTIVVSTFLIGIATFTKTVAASTGINSSIVATGDNSNMLLYVALIGGCPIAMIIIIFFMKKSKKKDETEEKE